MPDTQPLNIVHVILSRGFAGSERSTAESCNQQCKDHRVTLIVRKDHRRHGASIVDHIDTKVSVIEIPSLLFTRMFLARALARIKPDIIHAHLRRSTRLVAKVRTSAKKLSTLHITVNGPHFAKMDGLICNARWQLQDVPDNYRGQVFKANNSLIPHRRLGADEIATLRQQLEVGEDELLIAAVGRYKPTKGWDTLINAFVQLPQFDKARLLFLVPAAWKMSSNQWRRMIPESASSASKPTSRTCTRFSTWWSAHRASSRYPGSCWKRWMAVRR